MLGKRQTQPQLRQQEGENVEYVIVIVTGTRTQMHACMHASIHANIHTHIQAYTNTYIDVRRRVTYGRVDLYTQTIIQSK